MSNAVAVSVGRGRVFIDGLVKPKLWGIAFSMATWTRWPRPSQGESAGNGRDPFSFVRIRLHHVLRNPNGDADMFPIAERGAAGHTLPAAANGFNFASYSTVAAMVFDRNLQNDGTATFTKWEHHTDSISLME